MAAAVAVSLSSIHNELGGVLPPSALVQHTPRHGRSRGMSFKGKGRSYSVVEDRDVSIAKALMFVLKRAIQEDEKDEEDEGEFVVADSEGWVAISDVLSHSKLKEFGTTLEDIERVISNAIKARFHLRRRNPSGDATDPSSWEVSRAGTNRDSVVIPEIPEGEPLTANSPDLPDFIVYETSYQRYPLIITAGAIAQPPGGAKFLSFRPATADDVAEAAEVSIWVHLKSALQAEPTITWQRTDSGAVFTTAEVPTALWKKAVARRPDIGVLFEDGQVRKEVPAALRGKGAKGKARKGKGAGALGRDGSGDDSGSASEE